MASSILALPQQARLLKDEESVQGLLRCLEPVGDGLLHVQIGAIHLLIPDIMQKKLAKFKGARIMIARVGQQYGVGKAGLSQEVL